MITNFLRAHPAVQPQIIEAGFYFFSYGFFSLLWMRYIHHFLSVRPPQLKWLIGSIAAPLGLSLGLEAFCLIVGHGPSLQATAASAAGVFTSILIPFLYGLIASRCSAPY